MDLHQAEPTTEWLSAKFLQYGSCRLDLPFKLADDDGASSGPAAGPPAGVTATAGSRYISRQVSTPDKLSNYLRSAADPTGACLAAVHSLVQSYTAPADALYGVRGLGDSGSPAFVFADESSPTASLDTVMAGCSDAWKSAKPHAAGCGKIAAAAEHNSNGEGPPQPEVYLQLTAQPEAMAPADGTLLAVDIDVGSATISVTWDGKTLDSTYVKQMPEHLLAFLSTLCEHSEAAALSVDYLTADERQLLSVDCNETSADFPRVCTHNILKATAQKLPAQPALICGDATWSYAQLDEWSDKAATYMKTQHKVGPNTRVGVYLERRVELVGCLLAIMKCGATYVPLDPVYPRDRIAMMVEDGQTTALITSEALMGAADQIVEDAKVKCSIIAIDNQTVQTAIGDQELPGDVADTWNTDPESLAYIIFTSGSTGRPKGVPIRHKSLVNFVNSFVSSTDLSSLDVLLAVTTICFDIAGLELYLPLVRGATIVLTTAEQQADPSALQTLMVSQKVTILQATPVTWRLLLGNGWTGSDKLTALCGGEPLPPDLAMQVRPLVRRLLNVYGPTETTIWSTLECIELDSNGKVQAPVSIGGPIDNTTVYVVDQNMRLCAPGVRGELLIGGAGVSPGYWLRKDLSDGRFVPSPFVDGDTLYHTGDLVRWAFRDNEMKNPSLECLGRLDNQVKIRGFRIELAEIESALTTSDLVDQVVVDAMELFEGSPTKELVAYIKSPRKRDGSPASSSESTDNTDSGKDLEEAEAWGAVYDEAYATKRAATDDPTLNWSGYDNSYTPGVLHKEATVKEWVERICERIQKLPYSRVLELGAGNGMILFRIIKERPLEKYIGTDLSTEACSYVEDVLKHNPDYNKFKQVSVAAAGAHEAERFVELSPDLIICNGVSMYFPSAAYLLSVINNSLATVEPGGVFYLGDVRCKDLHQHFIASVDLHLAPDDEPYDSFAARVLKSQQQEKELLVDPEFFIAVLKAGMLPSCARIEIDMREGIHHTEFANFRYDVTFWKAVESDTAPAPVEYEIETYDPVSHANFEGCVEQRLASGQDFIAFSGVPDARLLEEDLLVRVLQSGDTPKTTGDLKAQVKAAASKARSVEPDMCYRRAEQHGYKATLMWTPGTSHIKFDVLFQKFDGHVCVGIAEATRTALPASTAYAADMDIESFTNKTGQDDEEDSMALSTAEISLLRSQLRDRLPDYMIPAVFVAVEEFPQTNNGKIDRKSLPKPQRTDIEKSVRTSEFVAPKEGVEADIANIWSSAFGLGDISAVDDFYELGGHSLIAMKIINEVKKTFGVNMTMAQLFEASTPGEMAVSVHSAGAAAEVFSAGLPVHDESTIQAVQDFPFYVNVMRHVWIPMRDGVRLAARIWMPAPSLSSVPSIIEVLPYRKSGGTTEIDEATYPYFAGHGIACIRVDSRGSGDSEGDFDDEYSEVQQQDGVDVVNWAADQAWCNGDCGMMGCSWGGFIAMQVAAKCPKSLKAILAVCATDKRLEDDMHFSGGALLSENHSWSSWLMHTLSLPPDPLAVGESWREQWVQRLASSVPLAGKWQQHSGTDASEKYWDTGSLDEAPKVPSFLVGGWSAGGYTNSVFRLAANLKEAGVAHKAVVGPWAHAYPHVSPIGPQYNFLADALEWWKQHLCVGGTCTSVVPPTPTSPRVQVYSICPISTGPDAQPSTIPGTWLDFDNLNESSSPLSLGLGDAKLLADTAAVATSEQTVRFPNSGLVGLRGGRWFTFGASPDHSVDQADDDQRSSCFDYEAAEVGVVISGQPTATLALEKPAGDASGWGTVCARLCAVAPSGVSTRITYGVVNVDRQAKDPAARRTTVTVKMDHAAFTLPAGHKLRLAVSHGYWPIVAKPENSSSLGIVIGGQSGSILSITTTSADAASKAVVATVDQDVVVPVMSVSTNVRKARDAEWVVREDTNGGAQVTSLDDRGCRRLHSEGDLEIDSTVSEVLVAEGTDASHRVEWRTTIARSARGESEAWCADVSLTSEQTLMPGGGVKMVTRLEAHEGAAKTPVATREWNEVMHR